jgi:hypothetical protein
MNEIGRRIVRSGAYALLATAFVLACSLLVPEEADTRSALRSDPTQLSSFTGSSFTGSSFGGSTDQDQPDPGAGR